MKIVINSCYGGFEISNKAYEMLCEKRGVEVGDIDRSDYYCSDARTDTDLVAVVEELGEEANTCFARLRVVEIDDSSTDWRIDEYDGLETVWYVVDGKMHYTSR